MKKTVFLFFLSALLFNCSSSDDSSSNNMGDSYISAKIDGTNFIATGGSIVNSIHAQLIESESYFSMLISGLVVDESYNSQSIGIGFGGTDFNSVVTGLEAVGSDDMYSLSGYYSFGDSETNNSSESDEDEYLKITSIDKENQTISGEFRFVAIDDDESSITYNITNGVFNNIEYTVQD